MKKTRKSLKAGTCDIAIQKKCII